MTTKTKGLMAFRALLALLAVSTAVIYSCNNNAATDAKKADSTVTVVDTSAKMVDTTKKMAPADTTKDTGRDTKVPRPPSQ